MEGNRYSVKIWPMPVKTPRVCLLHGGQISTDRLLREVFFLFQVDLELHLEFSMASVPNSPKTTRLLEILISIIQRLGGKPK